MCSVFQKLKAPAKQEKTEDSDDALRYDYLYKVLIND